MIPIELWRSKQFSGSYKLGDLSHAFDAPGGLILVESQEEEDYLWAMQLMYGGTVTLARYDPAIPMRTYRMKAMGYVYCTWDPNDPNRI